MAIQFSTRGGPNKHHYVSRRSIELCLEKFLVFIKNQNISWAVASGSGARSGDYEKRGGLIYAFEYEDDRGVQPLPDTSTLDADSLRAQTPLFKELTALGDAVVGFSTTRLQVQSHTLGTRKAWYWMKFDQPVIVEDLRLTVDTVDSIFPVPEQCRLAQLRGRETTANNSGFYSNLHKFPDPDNIEDVDDLDEIWEETDLEIIVDGGATIGANSLAKSGSKRMYVFTKPITGDTDEFLMLRHFFVGPSGSPGAFNTVGQLTYKPGAIVIVFIARDPPIFECISETVSIADGLLNQAANAPQNDPTHWNEISRLDGEVYKGFVDNLIGSKEEFVFNLGDNELVEWDQFTGGTIYGFFHTIDARISGSVTATNTNNQGIVISAYSVSKPDDFFVYDADHLFDEEENELNQFFNDKAI